MPRRRERATFAAGRGLTGMRTRQVDLAALVLALLAPGGASAAWGPTQDLGPAGSFGYDGNARGDRIAVWESASGFQFAQARPGEQLGPPRTLPGDPGRAFSFLRSLRVELDERGNALLVWNYFDETDPEYEVRGDGPCCEGLRARVIRRDGSFTGAKALAPTGHTVYLEDMQAAPSGALAVAFTLYPYTDAQEGPALNARLGSVRRGFGVRERVRSGQHYGPFALSFHRRRARMLWVGAAASASTHPPIYELERRARGRWTHLRPVLTRTPLMPEKVSFATAPDGSQAAVLARRGKDNPFVDAVVSGAVRSPGRPFRLRRLGSDTFTYEDQPQVAIEPRGSALTAWFSNARDTVVAAGRRPPAAFGPLVRFGAALDPNTDVPGVTLDVNGRGRGLLAWSERPFAPFGEPQRSQIVGALRNNRGTMLERHLIEDVQPYYADATATSIDSAGRGHVAYTSGGRLKVIAARIGG